jgi:hypothetical protein
LIWFILKNDIAKAGIGVLKYWHINIGNVFEGLKDGPLRVERMDARNTKKGAEIAPFLTIV